MTVQAEYHTEPPAVIRLSAETLGKLRLYAEKLATSSFNVHSLTCVEGELVLSVTYGGGKEEATRLFSEKLTDDSMVYLRGLISDWFVSMVSRPASACASPLPSSR
jgi:hypothetical protein